MDDRAELEALLSVIPERVAAAVRAHKDEALLEVVLDLGRPPAIRYTSGELVLEEAEVTEQELEYVVRQVSEFGEDNRAGIERTLHRISAMRNRRSRIVGLTCRAGRAVSGSAGVVRDLIESGRSILLLGRPGVGKTTMLREAARVLADEFEKRVVIVDTSNEIGGDGDIPHPGVGRARRMQVPRPELQHRVMIEAVENHMPEVIVIDEISAALEAEAARTIAERGVQLIATAHGNTLNNLMQNPTLSDLIGGIESVTLGDEEARRRSTQKTVLERRSAPTFQSLVEIQSFSRVAVHEDIARTVDALLRGFDVEAEIRTVDAAGDVETVERLQLHGSPDGAAEATAEERATPVPPAPGGPPRRLLPFGVSRNRLEEAIENTHSAAAVVDSLRDADAVMTLRHYYRQRTGPLREAETRGVPVYVLRNNTVTQMEQSLLAMRSEGEESDPLTAALREAEDAVTAVSFHGRQSIELSPQNAYIRRLQHELASRHGLNSASRGREPYRRITVAAGDRPPNVDLPWSSSTSR
ncbi:MAG: R3H domain-containing nucleic acid-binding protein [Dehalococcoidia bacterium]